MGASLTLFSTLVCSRPDLAALSASSFPVIPICAGHHAMVTWRFWFKPPLYNLTISVIRSGLDLLFLDCKETSDESESDNITFFGELLSTIQQLSTYSHCRDGMTTAAATLSELWHFDPSV